MSYNKQSILFISELDKSVTESMLYQLFNEYPVISINIARDYITKESYGYAFIEFKNRSLAEDAVKKLNYSKLNTKTIRLSWYNRGTNHFRNCTEFNIFIKNISKETTHQEFHDQFSQFGNIISARLMEDEDGVVMGYGFVQYDSEESAKNAIRSCHESMWNGKKLYVSQFVKNKPKRAKMFNNVYVKNIPKSWDKEDIEKIFSKFGAIKSTVIFEPNQDNICKELPKIKREWILNHKFAFVCFHVMGPAKNAVNQVSFYKISDEKYNEKIDRLVILLRQNLIEEDNLHKCAAYLLDNLGNEILQVYSSNVFLQEHIQNFRNALTENDGVYIFKDKNDRLECFPAQEKKERVKFIKENYERIKKKIKEKYKFCNLYIKNLPETFSNEALNDLFSKFGEIRSAKIVKKEFPTILGNKRNVKVFGFVCFFDPQNAREAKIRMDKTILSSQKLYIDYHQSKQERAEYLKLQMIRQSSNGKKMNLLAGMPMIMRQVGMVEVKKYLENQMLMSWFLRSGVMNPGIVRISQQMAPPKISLDPNARADYYGEKLFSIISSKPKYSRFDNFFAKIVGIFLDLDDNILERLITDGLYLDQQVNETIRLLTEKVRTK